MSVDAWGVAPSVPADGGWKADVVSPQDGGWQPDGFSVASDEAPFTGIADENISKHAAVDGGCRICGDDRHFARDCPEKKDNSGECYNCGEVGHNKADCPNPRVEREFTGTCNICEESGHRARDCPKRPTQVCKLCKSPDHAAAECSNNRIATLFTSYRVADMSPQEAWTMLQVADSERDVESIRTGILTYTKGFPEVTFIDLETSFREMQMNTYLIAKTQEISDTHTIINLQGEIDQKYVISIQFSPKPKRVMFAAGWPSDQEDNKARLTEAGFVVDRGVDKCNNCDQIGHKTRECPEERVEKGKVEITCNNCNETGHRFRDCPAARKTGGRECRHCGETGHIAKDCPTKEPETCRNCGEEGHRAKECEKERVMRCRNCDAEGHSARECPEPRNMDKVQCRNCDEMGHFSKECPKPTDWSRVECSNCHEKGHSYKRCTKQAAEEDADGGDGGDGGWGAPSAGALVSGGDDGGW